MSATLQQLLAQHGITATAEYADSNPYMDDSANMNHYQVTLKRGRKRMTVTFSMGYAHEAGPDVATVMDCLLSDSLSVDNARGFEDWADGLGYGADSRKAERTYKVILHQRHKLICFLGEELYAELAEAERL